MKLTITKRDITLGVARDCYECPVARGLQRATGDNEAFLVDALNGLYLVSGDRALEAPEDISRWIYKFDIGANLSPRVFSLPSFKKWPIKHFDGYVVL